MATRRRWVVIGTGLALAALAACERKNAAPANVTVESVVPPRAESVVVAVAQPWRAEDGAFLLVAGDEAGVEGTVIPPDTLDPIAHGVPQGAARRVELIGRGGRMGTAELTPVRPVACGWPRVRLALHDTRGDSARWSVAFAPGVARAVPLDSLDHLTRADSVKLVADLARVLSALPDDTVARYRGLPFAVRGAWTFAAASGVQGVVAEVHRRVAQEANQYEERVLLLAERDSTPGARWRAAWWTRTQGTEEAVEAVEALAMLTLATDHDPTLLAGHDAPGGPWQEFVARDSLGRWHTRWRSAPPPACESAAR